MVARAPSRLLGAEVIRAQFALGDTVPQDTVDHHQERMRDRHQRFALAQAADETVVLRAKGGAFLADGGPGAFPQHPAQPHVSFGGLAPFALARALPLARTEP